MEDLEQHWQMVFFWNTESIAEDMEFMETGPITCGIRKRSRDTTHTRNWMRGLSIVAGRGMFGPIQWKTHSKPWQSARRGLEEANPVVADDWVWCS